MWLRFVCLIVLFPQWAVAEELRLSYGVESFFWEEFNDRGDSLLDESGFRHLFSLDSESQISLRWNGDFNGHLFIGTVDYDGQDSLGNPVKTDTEYTGLGAEAGFSYLFNGRLNDGDGAAQTALRLALGLEKWDRDLQGLGGYREKYLVSYGRVAGVYASPSLWRAELGVKQPISTSESIDLSAFGFVGDVELSPKGKTSMYANVSYRIDQRISLKLAYDGYLFDQSDDEIVYNLNGNYYAVHQPESRMRTISLNLSMAL